MSSRSNSLRWTPSSVSVVMPVFDEELNVEPAVEDIVATLRPLGLPFEVVVVDDGSGDGTLGILRGMVGRVPELVVVALRRNFGQTAALQAGFDRARGDAIVTMDGDRQNDPREIPRLLEVLSRGADVVSGWRRHRQDALVLRRIPSWVANWLIRRMTGVSIHDQGCALKAYRSEVVRGLDLYADMHRFIATLTMPFGCTIEEIEVRHHPRREGSSKYGISRTLVVLADLFTIQMLSWFRERPIQWFSLLGLPFLAASLLSLLLGLGSQEVSVVPGALAVVNGTTFLSCLMLGLFAEFVPFASSRASRGRIVRELGESS